jgi:hypothetical protein
MKIKTFSVKDLLIKDLFFYKFAKFLLIASAFPKMASSSNQVLPAGLNVFLLCVDVDITEIFVRFKMYKIRR